MSSNGLENIIGDLEKIRQCNETINKEIASIRERIDRCIEVCDNTPQILNESTNEFNRLTSIFNKKDIPFFVFSVILQCGVKYLIKVLREMSDKELADKTPFHNTEKSNRYGNKYYVTKEEIVANPVPFDAVQKEHNNQWYEENGQQRPGFSGFNHRTTALGHDPLLGLFIGTANIMTSTITRYDFVSWHVSTKAHLRTARNGKEYFAYLDTISERANTIEIFRSIIDRLKNEGDVNSISKCKFT